MVCICNTIMGQAKIRCPFGHVGTLLINCNVIVPDIGHFFDSENDTMNVVKATCCVPSRWQ